MHSFLSGLRTLLLLLVVVVFAYLAVSILKLDERLAIGSEQTKQNAAFYDLSSFSALTNNPGELLRTERLYSAPDGIEGWRMLYRSTDIHGNPIIASGLVATPSSAPVNNLPVIAWAHPTTGIAPKCGPSVGIDPFDSIENLRALVGAGYSVVGADYSGMGAAGPASFLIGESEGRTVLDSVRASKQLLKQQASNDVVFWGHSQGGHAALFSSQIAPTYAPELNVKGVAVAASATDLGNLLKADIDTIGGVTIGSYVFNAYNQAYGADLNTVLTKQAQSTLTETANYCLLGQNSQIHQITRPLIGNFLSADPSTVEPWATLLKQNTPIGPMPETPLFVAQGLKDGLIVPTVTDGYVAQQKARGVTVTYDQIPNATHATVALDASGALLTWLKGINK